MHNLLSFLKIKLFPLRIPFSIDNISLMVLIQEVFSLCKVYSPGGDEKKKEKKINMGAQNDGIIK